MSDMEVANPVGDHSHADNPTFSISGANFQPPPPPSKFPFDGPIRLSYDPRVDPNTTSQPSINWPILLEPDQATLQYSFGYRPDFLEEPHRHESQITPYSNLQDTGKFDARGNVSHANDHFSRYSMETIKEPPMKELTNHKEPFNANSRPSSTLPGLTQPRPWSQALDDALKAYYPKTESFEHRMNLLTVEWTTSRNSRRHLESMEPKTHLATPGITPHLRSQEPPPRFSSAEKIHSNSPSTTVSYKNIPTTHFSAPKSINYVFVEDNNNRAGQKKRRRAYTVEEREEVSQTRKRGACSACRSRHKKVPTFAFIL
jgi:hypothetical protein